MAAQQKLQDAHVAVIGAGGLGSPALLYLAAAGVGRISVIDDDAVELSNLHRQVIHAESAVGHNKAQSAVRELQARNSDITVEAVEARLTSENAGELLAGADVILDGTDNFPARYAVSGYCSAVGIPHVWGSILGFDAQLAVFWAGHGPVYTDIFPSAPPEGAVPSCAENGVLGPLVGVVGTAMALEAVKILSGVGEPLVRVIGYFSGLEGKWEYIELAPEAIMEQMDEPTPSAPGDSASGDSASGNPASGNPVLSSSLLNNSALNSATMNPTDSFAVESRDLLLDVRERTEFEAFHIPGARNVPLSGLKQEIPHALLEELRAAGEEDKRVVVYCAAGVRSAEAISLLTSAMEQEPLPAAQRCAVRLENLPGGINAWLDSLA